MAALLATQNGRAWIATSGGALGYLGLCALLGRHQLLPRWLPSRKMIHIGALLFSQVPRRRRHRPPHPALSPVRSAGTGPLFMFCWPLYGPGPAARWVAASVPAAAGVVFALVGCRVLHSDALVSVTSVSVCLSAWRSCMRHPRSCLESGAATRRQPLLAPPLPAALGAGRGAAARALLLRCGARGGHAAAVAPLPRRNPCPLRRVRRRRPGGGGGAIHGAAHTPPAPQPRQDCCWVAGLLGWRHGHGAAAPRSPSPLRHVCSYGGGSRGRRQRRRRSSSGDAAGLAPGSGRGGVLRCGSGGRVAAGGRARQLCCACRYGPGGAGCAWVLVMRRRQRCNRKCDWSTRGRSMRDARWVALLGATQYSRLRRRKSSPRSCGCALRRCPPVRRLISLG